MNYYLRSVWANAHSFARRNWFLERVLKLGLTQIAKEYQCVRHSRIRSVRLSETFSVQPAPILLRALASSKRSGGRLITLSSVLVGIISSLEPTACPYLPTGPCQPSMVYRYLRTLEGVTPPLSLTHLSCQITAKAFAATRTGLFSYPFTPHLHKDLVIVFDRMFSLGLRGSGLNTTPLGAQSGTAAQTGPRRHFLYCTLKPETAKRQREISTIIS